jgi:hypothetical protein
MDSAENPSPPIPAPDPSRSSKLWNRFLCHNLRLGNGRDVHLAFWLLATLALCFLAYISRVHEITHDVFHEMALFREFLVLGEFPKSEIFSYTDRVHPSVHHEWATGALLYFATVASGLGLTGLVVLKFGLVSAMWLVLYRVARMRGAHPYIFAIFSVLCFPVFWVGFGTVRAQLFTLLFVAIQLWMQELDYRGRRWWCLPWLAMFVLWLNVHAGFVVGCGMIAFHSIERFYAAWSIHKSIADAVKATGHLLVLGPIAAGATLLNPYGWQYIPYLVRAISMERPLIREWLPLWHTHEPSRTLTLFTICLLLFALGFYANRKRMWHGAAFLGLAAFMTLKHIRHGSIFGAVWIAYVPAWFSRTLLGKRIVDYLEARRSTTIVACQVMCGLFLAFACYQPFWKPTLPPLPRYSSASFPSNAIEYLRAHDFEGNLMTPFHVGAYVSWEMYPAVKVSFDGRYEVAYQPHMMPDHNRFYNAEENWWEILDKYPTDAVLIHKQAKVCEQLSEFASPAAVPHPTRCNWRFIYEDDAFIILASQDVELPRIDRRGVTILDAAAQAFTYEDSHWYRASKPRILAQQEHPDLGEL